MRIYCSVAGENAAKKAVPQVEGAEDKRKHRNHPDLIDHMKRDGLSGRLEKARSLRTWFELFLSYPLFGPFLALRFAIDIKR
jgi:hypothetical protein